MENQKLFKMSYSLGTNFDPELFNVIEEIDKEKTIKSLFGKLPKDIIGGGRTRMVLPSVSWKQLKLYVAECNRRGYKFNYLLNPLCIDNKDTNKKWNAKIVKFIGELSDMGISALTINSPYLCELIKAQFPHLFVTIGIYACVQTLLQCKYWEELGADEITLMHDLNRNFPLLREMLTFFKNRSLHLRLIANNVCLHECPYVNSHGAFIGHASDEKHFSHLFNIDYCLLKCNLSRLTNPTKILTSCWIRPEDVEYYEKVAEETGNNKLSIKLLDRTKTTNYLRNVIKAYIERSFDGNVLDFVNFITQKDTVSIKLKGAIMKMIIDMYNFKSMALLRNIFKTPKLYVDNKKLDGFLEKFYKNYDCRSHMCDDIGKEFNKENGDKNEKYCYYCKTWANKAISYDGNEETIKQWIADCTKFIKDLSTSKVFKPFN